MFCCSAKPRYKRLVDGSYSNSHHGGGGIMSQHVTKLISYAHSQERRLRDIGVYLEEKIRGDLNRGRYGHVVTGVQILRYLTSSVPAMIVHSTLSIINICQALLRSPGIEMKELGADLLAKCARMDYLAGNNAASKSVISFVDDFVAQCHDDNEDTALRERMRLCGLKGLQTILQVFGNQVSPYFESIVPAILDNLRNSPALHNTATASMGSIAGAAQAAPAVSSSAAAAAVAATATTAPSSVQAGAAAAAAGEVVEPSAYAVEMLQDISRTATQDVTRLMLENMLKYFDQHDLWQRPEFPLTVFKIVQKTLPVHFNYLPVTMLLQRVKASASHGSGDIETRTRIIAFVASLLRSLRGSVPVPMFRRVLSSLTYLLTELADEETRSLSADAVPGDTGTEPVNSTEAQRAALRAAVLECTSYFAKRLEPSQNIEAMKSIAGVLPLSKDAHRHTHRLLVLHAILRVAEYHQRIPGKMVKPRLMQSLLFNATSARADVRLVVTKILIALIEGGEYAHQAYAVESSVAASGTAGAAAGAAIADALASAGGGGGGGGGTAGTAGGAGGSVAGGVSAAAAANRRSSGTRVSTSERSSARTAHMLIRERESVSGEASAAPSPRPTPGSVQFGLQYGAKIHDALYQGLIASNNEPSNMVSLSRAFNVMLKEFGANELEHGFPLMFAVQEAADTRLSSGDLSQVRSQALHMVVASYLLSVGHVYRNESVRKHVATVVRAREADGQACSLLDLQPEMVHYHLRIRSGDDAVSFDAAAVHAGMPVDSLIDRDYIMAMLSNVTELQAALKPDVTSVLSRKYQPEEMSHSYSSVLQFPHLRSGAGQPSWSRPGSRRGTLLDGDRSDSHALSARRGTDGGGGGGGGAGGSPHAAGSAGANGGCSSTDGRGRRPRHGDHDSAQQSPASRFGDYSVDEARKALTGNATERPGVSVLQANRLSFVTVLTAAEKQHALLNEELSATLDMVPTPDDFYDPANQANYLDDPDSQRSADALLATLGPNNLLTTVFPMSFSVDAEAWFSHGSEDAVEDARPPLVKFLASTAAAAVNAATSMQEPPVVRLLT